MALPRLHDLLPDHIFHDPSTAPHPPPPSSILPHYPYYQPLPQNVPLRPLASAFPPPLPEIPYSTHQAYTNGDSSLPDGGFPVDDRIYDVDHRFERHYADEIDPDNTSEGIGEAEGEKRKHACSLCGKRFNRPSSLRIHLNTHTGAKPYICPFPGCNRSFNVSSNMRRHYRNHARRVPPPLPIDDVHSHARDSQSRAQMHRVIPPIQNQLSAQSRVQRDFSVEPPVHLRNRPQQYHQKVTVGLPSTNGSRSASSDGDKMGSTARGAEAAARAAMKESAGSGSGSDSITDTLEKSNRYVQAQYSYPYPPTSDCAQPLPTLSSSYSQDHFHVYNGQQRQPALTYPPASNSINYSEERIFDLEPRYHRQGNVPELSPVAYQAEHELKTYYDGHIPPTPPYTSETALSPSSYHAPPTLHASGHLPPSFASSYDPPSQSVRAEQGDYQDRGHTHPRNGAPKYADPGTAHEYSHFADETQKHSSYHSVSSERTGTRSSTYSSHHGDLPYTPDRGKFDDRHAPKYASEYEYHHTHKQSRAPEESSTVSVDRCSIPMSWEGHDGNDPNAESGPGRRVESAVRQQPSPDTPSLHVSELHNGLSHQHDEEKRQNTLRVEEIPRECDHEAPRHTRSRSGGLHLHDLIHPAPQEPQCGQAPRLKSSKSPQECFKVASPVVSRSLSHDPIIQADPDRGRSESMKTSSKSEAVGQTPGAAPPPPYPLYSLPPCTLTDEVEDTAEQKRKSSGGRDVGRATKRRRRG